MLTSCSTPESTADIEAFTRRFGWRGLQELPQVATVLSRIHQLLDGAESTWNCAQGGLCERQQGDNGFVGAYVDGGQVHVCPATFTHAPEPRRVIIHEAAHLAGLHRVDIYEHDARFFLLDTADAIRNPDSYARYVLDVQPPLVIEFGEVELDPAPASAP